MPLWHANVAWLILKIVCVLNKIEGSHAIINAIVACSRISVPGHRMNFYEERSKLCGLYCPKRYLDSEARKRQLHVSP